MSIYLYILYLFYFVIIIIENDYHADHHVTIVEYSNIPSWLIVICIHGLNLLKINGNHHTPIHIWILESTLYVDENNLNRHEQCIVKYTINEIHNNLVCDLWD